MNTDAVWRMRPIPTLSGAWVYYLTLADLRTDLEANGTHLAEVEVFDTLTYVRYGLLRMMTTREQSQLTPSQPPAA